MQKLLKSSYLGNHRARRLNSAITLSAYPQLEARVARKAVGFPKIKDSSFPSAETKDPWQSSAWDTPPSLRPSEGYAVMSLKKTPWDNCTVAGRAAMSKQPVEGRQKLENSSEGTHQPGQRARSALPHSKARGERTERPCRVCFCSRPH